MDVFKAETSFDWPDRPKYYLPLKAQDLFDVIDRTNRDWWGVRRLSDNSLGFASSKCLCYVERRGIDRMVAKQYSERLFDIKNKPDFEYVDVYSIPPCYVQTIDTWIGNLDDLPSPVKVPMPDYDSDKEENNSPPPQSDVIPPPDYNSDDDNYDDNSTGLTAAQRLQKSLVVNPKYLQPAPESEQHLIKAQKLRNPVKESLQHQALHKELAFTAKQGLSKVLRSKSELQREIEKRSQRDKKCLSANIDKELWHRLEEKHEKSETSIDRNVPNETKEFEHVLSKLRKCQTTSMSS